MSYDGMMWIKDIGLHGIGPDFGEMTFGKIRDREKDRVLIFMYPASFCPGSAAI